MPKNCPLRDYFTSECKSLSFISERTTWLSLFISKSRCYYPGKQYIFASLNPNYFSTNSWFTLPCNGSLFFHSLPPCYQFQGLYFYPSIPWLAFEADTVEHVLIFEFLIQYAHVLFFFFLTFPSQSILLVYFFLYFLTCGCLYLRESHVSLSIPSRSKLGHTHIINFYLCADNSQQDTCSPDHYVKMLDSITVSWIFPPKKPPKNKNQNPKPSFPFLIKLAILLHTQLRNTSICLGGQVIKTIP